MDPRYEDPGQWARGRSWPPPTWIQWSYWYWYMVIPAMYCTYDVDRIRRSPLCIILIGMISCSNDGSWTGRPISICASGRGSAVSARTCSLLLSPTLSSLRLVVVVLGTWLSTVSSYVHRRGLTLYYSTMYTIPVVLYTIHYTTMWSAA